MSACRQRWSFGAVVVATALAVGFALAVAIVLTVDLTHTDFTEEYASATLLRAGHGAAMYDAGRQAATEASAGASGTFSPASWAPPAQLLIVPLTLLPLRAATLIWILVQVISLAGAAVVAARAAPWASGCRRETKLICVGAALAGLGALMDVVDGQWDGIPTLGLALAYADLRKGRDSRAMLWLVMTGLAGKPHLALGLGLFLLARRPRTLVGGAATALLMTAGAVFLVPVGALQGFVANISSQNADHVLVAGSVGIPGMFTAVVDGGAGWVLGYAGSAVLLGGCLVLGRRSRQGRALEPAFLCVTLISVLANTHVFHYDFAQLVPAVVGMLAWSGQRDAARGQTWPGPATRAVLGASLLVTVVGDAEVLPLGRYTPSPWLPALLVASAALCGAVAAAWPSASPEVRTAAA